MQTIIHTETLTARRVGRVAPAPESCRASDRARRKIGSTGHEVESAAVMRRTRRGANAGMSAGDAMT